MNPQNSRFMPAVAHGALAALNAFAEGPEVSAESKKR